MKKNEAISILATSARPREPKNRTRYDEAIKMAIVALQQPEQRWIPCSERLPKVRQWVLCQCRAGIIDVLRLTDDGCWYRKSNEIYMSGFVLAWMPLPEPYKRGEQDEDQEEGS